MNKPMTTAELFDKICNILKEKGLYPDILDYALAEYTPKPITNYEYSLRNNLDYGGSEGIYLDLWIETDTDCGAKRYNWEPLRRLKTVGMPCILWQNFWQILPSKKMPTSIPILTIFAGRV